MKTTVRIQRQSAMTTAEVLAVLLTLVIAAGLLLPALMRPQYRGSRINCVSNVKQIGLALRMWSNDNAEKFPWQVPVATNGTFELAESKEVFRHFLAVSNELSSPKVLACTSDKDVTRVSDWSKVNNGSLSYFIGLDSNEAFPETILSGDRNIVGGTAATNRIFLFNSNSPAGWSQEMHKHQGNLGLGDGSAQQFSSNSLRRQIQAALLSTNVAALRFSIPKPN